MGTPSAVSVLLIGINYAPEVTGIGPYTAGLADRKFRVPVGLIFQDLMGPAAAQSGYQGGRRVAGLTRSTEAFVARKADLVAVVSDGFRGYLETAGVPASRLQKVRNWARVVP